MIGARRGPSETLGIIAGEAAVCVPICYATHNHRFVYRNLDNDFITPDAALSLNNCTLFRGRAAIGVACARVAEPLRLIDVDVLAAVEEAGVSLL